MKIILAGIIVFLAYRIWMLKKRNSDIKTSLTRTEARLASYIEEEGTGQAKFNGMLASMVEGVLVIDTKGEIVLMNPSLRKTFLIDQMPEGKRPLEVIRNAKIQEIVERTLKNEEKIISDELTLTVPEERFLKVNAVPIEWDGKNEGAILVFHDITELRRLERIRQDFVANVSHELRTPISSIKGYAETLMDGAIDDKENLRKFVEIIDRDSQRLADLIDDLLDLAKIESGKMKMSLVALDIREVIRKTILIVEKQAQAKSLSISCNFPENLPMVLGDETRLSQVVLNLLDNAIKYTPQSGQIMMEALAADPFVQINIADTGLGIPEKDLSRVFERFYRVDKARSRELGGTGLGLSIVKHIVQSHGGEVWVKSQLEKGSVFSFIIPQAPQK